MCHVSEEVASSMSQSIVWTYFSQWKHSFSFATHNKIKYHQNSLQPDVWYASVLWKDKENKQPRMKVVTNSHVDGVTHSNNKNDTAKNCGLAKLRQCKDSFTLSIYYLRRVGLRKLDGRGLGWVPLHNNWHERQEFALIQPAQKEIKYADLLKREPCDRFIKPNIFRIHMEQMVLESGTGCIKRIPRLKCGFEWKGKIFQYFIVSFVQPP